MDRMIELAVAADWEYDADFVSLIQEAALRQGLSFLAVWPENLTETLRTVGRGQTLFRFLLDRASSTSPEFLELQKLVEDSGAEVLEPIERVRWASDKATMHLEFISHGLHTPYTIILPPLSSGQPLVLGDRELSRLGTPFIIKPANTTGGSQGVVDDALSLDDVWTARQVYPADKYLLQEKVKPFERDQRRFWFRGFYVLGLVLVAWWSDQTHVYSELVPEEVERYGLQDLIGIVHKIRQVSNLRFFSTEVVRTAPGTFICVDYVNEPCDMRLKSRHFDGVPDRIVAHIAGRVVGFAKEKSGAGSDL